MRAARLLHMVLLLQNRGRLTSWELAGILEVSRRTVLRDVEALAEAGLPVVAHAGPQGGIELAFGYRTRLTGLSDEEAEAVGIMLSVPTQPLEALGLATAARRVQSKLIESLPDRVRTKATRTAERFRLTVPASDPDPRLPAVALAVRESRVVRLNATRSPRVVHPIGLRVGPNPVLFDAVSGTEIARAEWFDINISAHRFEETAPIRALREAWARPDEP